MCMHVRAVFRMEQLIRMCGRCMFVCACPRVLIALMLVRFRMEKCGVRMHATMYMFMYVRMYVCMCVYIYMYVHVLHALDTDL
jgi:hypothetical protein